MSAEKRKRFDDQLAALKDHLPLGSSSRVDDETSKAADERATRKEWTQVLLLPMLQEVAKNVLENNSQIKRFFFEDMQMERNVELGWEDVAGHYHRIRLVLENDNIHVSIKAGGPHYDDKHERWHYARTFNLDRLRYPAWKVKLQQDIVMVIEQGLTLDLAYI